MSLPLPPRRRALQTLSGLAALQALGGLLGCATPPAPAAAPAPGLPPPNPATQPPQTLPANPALPTLLLVGDSTVRNGRDDGQGLGPLGQWGWGHVLARYLDAGQCNVVNRAVGGLSSRTFRTAGHWQRAQALLKPGDVVLIQFGHNDSSPVNDAQRARGTLRGTGPETQAIVNQLSGQAETVYTYGAYLRGYIADCRALGATPVLCTPVPRKRWGADGRTLRDTARYAGWAAEVARQEGVALIDLDDAVAARYDALGPTVVGMLFPREPEDRVHTNWAGAALNAQTVRGQLQAQGLVPAGWWKASPVRAEPAEGPSAPTPNPTRTRTLPTLHLVGDSTVRSNGAGGSPAQQLRDGHWGWGERLAPWLDATQLQLANHAMGGRSTRTFWREGRWARVRAQLQPGDVVLIQFGHNDGGRVGDPAAKTRGVLPGTGEDTATETLPDGTLETVHSFGHYLARYLREALDAGAIPVVLSPVPHKDRWQAERDFADVAAWGRQVAQREGALFVDLTLRVTAAYRDIGAEAVNQLFSDARTHTNDAGARLNAQCVAAALRELPQGLLTPLLRAQPQEPAA
jgi:lysophospholipase L1-like esterase